MPPRGAVAGRFVGEEVRPREDVEVEAAEEEKGVVEVILVFDGYASEGVEVHDSIIVSGFQGVEELMRDSEEGEMFDVWIMFGGVRHDVVDVVVVFPPANGQAADEVCDDDSDGCVDLERVRYPHVA